MGCTSDDLRIVSPSGVLQICKNSEWENVCSSDWGNLDAAVACRQLGYDGMTIVVKCCTLLCLDKDIQEATHQGSYGGIREQWILWNIIVMDKKTIYKCVPVQNGLHALELLYLNVYAEIHQV